MHKMTMSEISELLFSPMHNESKWAQSRHMLETYKQFCSAWARFSIFWLLFIIKFNTLTLLHVHTSPSMVYVNFLTFRCREHDLQKCSMRSRQTIELDVFWNEGNVNLLSIQSRKQFNQLIWTHRLIHMKSLLCSPLDNALSASHNPHSKASLWSRFTHNIPAWKLE